MQDATVALHVHTQEASNQGLTLCKLRIRPPPMFGVLRHIPTICGGIRRPPLGYTAIAGLLDPDPCTPRWLR